MKRMFVIIALVLLLGAGCENRTCIKSHTEQYYSNQGTALFAATKNAAFLSQNGLKTRTVCDQYATTTSP